MTRDGSTLGADTRTAGSLPSDPIRDRGALDPVVQLTHASLALSGRSIWSDLSAEIRRGEFLVVIGPNGAGKTSLLRVLLGLQPTTHGHALVHGRAPRRGDPEIGYVPQQRAFDPEVPLRGRDLVSMGLDGHRWGVSVNARANRRRVDRILALVGAQSYADTPVGRLSGGEQQRLRIAQALVGDPSLLLCDEPLLSLDLHSQQVIVQLIARWSRDHRATVIFVTHDVNPVMSVADRILLLAGGRWGIGPVDRMMTAEALSRLYGVPVGVVEYAGRICILGADLGGHDPVTARGEIGE